MRVLSLKKILKIIFVALIAALVFLTGAVIARAEDEVAPVRVGDFAVIGEEGAYSFDSDTGILTITGDVTVSMAEGVDSTTQSMIVDSDATITLDGVTINAAKGPAIKIKAGVVSTIVLADGSLNQVTGSNRYAGIEVGLDNEILATLIIDGTGELIANGGDNSAGIGASYTNINSQGNSAASFSGNIIINGGVISAFGKSGGAGIGSGLNNTRNADGTWTGKNASYPMSFTKIGAITLNGGTIMKAYGAGGGAGIGSGSHSFTGVITINDGAVIKDALGTGGGAGIGCGIGSQRQENDFTKGPGNYYTEIVINGGVIESAKSEWLGAGIGGGYSCDAYIDINGGTITAIGGNGNEGANYQGGPGIGAGYMGLPVLKISDGTITAYGGTGAPGIGYGPGALAGNTQKERGKDAKISYDESVIDISGGNITAEGGVNGAGIGSGNGNQFCHINISGGTIKAIGYSDENNLLVGGAGIGSGTGLAGAATKYKADTVLDIKITGGNVVAIGGWGASGIGSGAANKMAESITINVDETEGGSVEAYADGTKFAIDTRILNEDGSTTSRTDGRNYTGDYLQGTFVHAYEYQDGEETRTQNPEGLESIIVTNDVTGWNKNLQQMPDGYRSFATSVVGTGDYTVYTDEKSIGNGEGRYFSICLKDQFDEDEIITKDGGTSEGGNNECIGVKYQVVQDALKDNFYLFPVKSVVVSKVVDADDTVKDGLNTTVYFALHNDTQGFATKKDGSVWTESIEIKNGKPQGKAYFVDVEDRAYDVWEVKGPSDTDNPKGEKFGAATLKSITTQHGGDMVLDTEEIQHGFKITKKEVTVDDKAMLQISAERIDALVTEDQSFTLSLYGDGKLIGSQKVNKESGLTLSWTVDRFVKDKDGNDTEQEINYVIKDTSNNAAIGEDQWSDEIVVTNTYEGLLTIKLSKLIEKYYQFEDGAKVNNTTVFKISIPSADDPDVNVFENYYAFTFTAAGEQNQEVEIALPKGAEKVVVEEVYGAGYRPVQEDEAGEAVAAPFKMEIDLTAEDFDLNTEQEITYTNQFAGKQIYSSGIINIYKDKAYVDPNQDAK